MVAQNWGIPPPDVDLYPVYEITAELEAMGIEARAEQWRRDHKR